MPRNEVRNGARLAVALGLGLALSLGAAPVVALAEPTVEQEYTVVATLEQPSATLMDEAPAAAPSSDTIATVGETAYTSLQEAVNAANGKTVVLAANINLSEKVVISSGTVTIDLSGFTIAGTETGASLPWALGVGKGATLLIRDSSENGGGKLTGGSSYPVLVNGTLSLESGSIVSGNGIGVLVTGEGSLLKMTGGTVSGISDGIKAQIDATVEISGGTVAGSVEQEGEALGLLGSTATISGDARLTGYSGVGLFNIAKNASDGVVVDNIAGSTTPSSFIMKGGSIDCKVYALSGNNLQSATCSANISGGSMTTEDTCIYWPMEGNLIISDGTFSGTTALEAKMGTINISNGTFTGTGESGSVYTGDGTSSDGSALKLVGQVYGGSDGQFLEKSGLYASITGGSFTSQKGNAISVYNAGVDADSNQGELVASVDIEDEAKLTSAANKDSIRVTSVVNDYQLVEGGAKTGNTTVTNSEVAKSAVGVQGVTVTQGNAEVSSFTLYSSLNNAINSTNGNETTITLLRDVTEDIFVPSSADITLNLNGKTLTGSVVNDGELELVGAGTLVGQVTGKDPIVPSGDSFENYVATVGNQRFSDIFKALAAASTSEEKTVTLAADIECDTFSVPAGVTLDGGNHTITCGTEYTSGAFITAGRDADNVTIKDVTIFVPSTQGDSNKHAVQFYLNEGGTLENVTVNGGDGTSVQVNGAVGVTLSSCTLKPNKGAYANIEYGMGSGVQTIPSLSVDDVSFKSGPAQIWADYSTVDAIKGQLPGIQTNDEVLDAITDNITNRNESALSVLVQLENNDQGIVSESVPSVTNPPYIPPAQTGERVEVEQPSGGKVSVSPSRADEGDVVTVTLTPDEGREAVSVTVTDEDGNVVEVEPGEKDGTWTFKMPDCAVTVTAETRCDGGDLCPSRGLADVVVGEWYHDAVDWAIDAGVMSGYGHVAAFGPSDPISRAQLAQVLWNRAGRPDADASAVGQFPDCSADEFYAEAVAWCSEAGIMTGYEDGDFGPSDEVTREQLATVLWRAAGSPEADADLSAYPDAADVSEFAEGAMAWAVEVGAVSGQGSDGTLDPVGTLERAQCAMVLYRLAE